jgi:hypothetical protein
MEDLGDLCGLSYEMAYVMKYGIDPPREEKEEKIIKCFDDAYLAESLAYESMYEPAQYECYRGWRFPEF